MTRKLTKAEAGKLGAIASLPSIAANYNRRVALYNTSPSTCNQCFNSMSYTKRNNKFCSSSCAASFNNTRKVSRLCEWECQFCAAIHQTTPSRVGKYCNNKCHNEYIYTNNIKQWVTHGVTTKEAPKYARRYLSEKYGSKCSECGVDEWNGIPLVFDIDHINGNPSDHSSDNLRLLCKNCHGQTETYGSKNNGKGRSHRY